jgi:hypothetical protein
MGLLALDPMQRTATAALAHDVFFAWWHEAERPLDLCPQGSLSGRPYLCTPAFVGRKRELEQARHFLRETLDYQVPELLRAPELTAQAQSSNVTLLPSSLLTLSGAPGTGKSRLLGEIVELALARDALVLQGQCISGIGAAFQSLGPVLTKLRAAHERMPLASFSGEHEASYAERVRESERMPRESDPAYESLGQRSASRDEERIRAEAARRFAMAQATARLLSVARRRPVVIVQEDSQWSDESSTATLGYLMRGVAQARALGHPARVAFLLTFRPESADNALSHIDRLLALQAELERPPTALTLSGLSPPETIELACSLLRVNETAELADLCELLFQRDSTPLFVEQTLRFLVDDDLLTRGMQLVRPDGKPRWSGTYRFDCTLVASGRRPLNVHDAVGMNVEHLSAGTTKLLPYAAACGREFELDLVASACGYEPIEALDFLDEAVAAGILGEVDELTPSDAAARVHERRFVFRHDRYREAIYQQLSDDTRRACHASLADALVALRGRVHAVAEVLSRHYEASGQDGLAYEQALAAAELAHAQQAFDRAADLYQRAVMLSARAGVQVPRSLREALARAALSAGLHPLAATQLEVLVADPRQSDEQRWDVSLRLAELEYLQQHYGSAIEPLERLLRSLGEFVPETRAAKNFGLARNLARIVLCAAIPGLVARASPAEPELTEIRARAWYALAECNHFVNFSDTLFAATSLGRLAVREGRHAFTAPALAVLVYAFAGQGLHRLSRAYGALTEEALAHEARASGGAELAHASARAMAHLLLSCGRLCRGELGKASEHALVADLGRGLSFAREAADPQRRWLILRVATFAQLLSGRLEAYGVLNEYLIESAHTSRLTHVANVSRDLTRAWTFDCAGDLHASVSAWEAARATASQAGSHLELLVASARRSFLLSLSERASSAHVAMKLAEQAQEAMSSWLEGGFSTCADWPLSQGLATLALVALRTGGKGLNKGGTLRALCAWRCRGNRLETPLYLAACALIELSRGRTHAAERRLNEARLTAEREGMIMQLLDVYRLAARAYPSNSAEALHYAAQALRLSEAMARVRSPSLAELLEGEMGPRVSA